MLCEKCHKREATTHIKSVVNGVKQEYNLCSECAKIYGYGTNSLTGMLDSMFGDISKYDSLPQTKVCSVCGASFGDIAKSGKVGCSECYNTFYDELLPYLKRVHGSVNHVGKVPNSAPLMVTPKLKSVKDLRQELSRLVAEENYEQAAIVRDKIKEMEAMGNE
jgi:protein arginine kinase activator